MAISRVSSLANSHRFIRVMVDEYGESRICGRIYHDSRDGGIKFKGLMHMAWAIEELLDELQYPVRSTDIRRFKRIDCRSGGGGQILESKKETSGKLMSFLLMVQHRQNASWQGEIRREDTMESKSFNSFLELVQILDGTLTKTNADWNLQQKQSSSHQICNVGIDEYEENSAGGVLYAKQAEEPLLFDSSIQMAKQMIYLLNQADSDVGQSKKLINQESLSYYRKRGKKATFCIQILFREHSSIQGIMHWKERREQTSFRSFLEMLMLMDAAISQFDTGKLAAESTEQKVI